MAVLLDALDTRTVDAPNTLLSAMKSSMTNDVKNSGHSTIWCVSRSAS